MAESPPPPVAHLAYAPQDALEIEFRYYIQQLEELIPKVLDHGLRHNLHLWVHRLLKDHFRIQKKMRDQRNKYLHFIVASFASGLFEHPIVNKPPPDQLLEIKDLKFPKQKEARWESDGRWKNLLNDIRAAYTSVSYMVSNKPLTCFFHEEQHCSFDQRTDTDVCKGLDLQFGFLLSMAQSLSATLKSATDVQKACTWIKTLAQIDKNHCTNAKELRNDYIMLLLGYMQNGALQGPFKIFPTMPIPPLREAAKLLPPERTERLELPLKNTIRDMRNIEEGAFACIFIKF